MAFNGAFTVSAGDSNSKIVLTDTSTGSDGNLTNRTISLYQADGTLLGGSVINWPLGPTTKELDVLGRDLSLNVVVNWVSSSPLPDPSTYTETELYTSVVFTEDFIYELLQDIAANPAILEDTKYYSNFSKLQTEVDSAELAQEYGSQYNAQSALDRAYLLISNQNIYF